MKGKNPVAVLVSLQSPEDVEILPLGAACVASALIKASLVEKENLSVLSGSVAQDEDLLFRGIIEKKPDLVGFSLYCWNSKVSTALAARLRKEFPRLLIIAGGPDAEWLAAGGPSQPFDAVFLGESEVSVPAWFAEVAGGAPAPAPVFIRGRPAGAAALPSPWLEGVLSPKRGGSVAWELTRGCPFRCAYCYEGRGLSGIRHLGAERLDAELDLFARAGVREVFVLDPTFNARGGRVLALLKRLAERAGDIHWNFEIRAELLDRKQAEAFARLPCSLQIGLQSANPEVLKKIGRNLVKKDFAAKIGLLNEAGAIFGLDLIYGLPGDSLSGFSASLDFALGLMPNHLDIFPLAILPGTELHDRREELMLECDTEPPYLLRSHPSFAAEDMELASKVAEACRVFYSEGRAVPWFLAILKPLHMSASAFLAGFATPSVRSRMRHRDIEILQCAYVSQLYAQKGKQRLLAAALDLIRYHGAWARAFAEGETTVLELSYALSDLESLGILNLENFSERNVMRRNSVEIKPGREGPIARILKGHA